MIKQDFCSPSEISTLWWQFCHYKSSKNTNSCNSNCHNSFKLDYTILAWKGFLTSAMWICSTQAYSNCAYDWIFFFMFKSFLHKCTGFLATNLTCVTFFQKFHNGMAFFCPRWKNNPMKDFCKINAMKISHILILL